MNGVAEIVGGVEDHIHLLGSLRPVHCVADVLRDLKKDSTNWVKDNFDRSFAWQEGICSLHCESFRDRCYAQLYREAGNHHRKGSFVDELKELLGKAGIAYEEKVTQTFEIKVEDAYFTNGLEERVNLKDASLLWTLFLSIDPETETDVTDTHLIYSLVAPEDESTVRTSCLNNFTKPLCRRRQPA